MDQGNTVDYDWKKKFHFDSSQFRVMCCKKKMAGTHFSRIRWNAFVANSRNPFFYKKKCFQYKRERKTELLNRTIPRIQGRTVEVEVDDGEVVFESLSEDDEDEGVVVGDDAAAAAAEIRHLRQRKEELERRHHDQQRRKLHLKVRLSFPFFFTEFFF